MAFPSNDVVTARLSPGRSEEAAVERVVRSLQSARAPLLVAADISAWGVALLCSSALWHLMGNPVVSSTGLLWVWAVVVVFQIVAASTVGDVIRTAPVGGPTNALLVSAVVFTGGFWTAIINALPFFGWLPLLVPVIAAAIALFLQVASRVTWRWLRERLVARRRSERGSRRTLVVGEGGLARQLVRSMLRDPEGRYWPVGFLAHDPRRCGKRACGLPVLGTDADVAALLSATGCDVVVLAAPALDPPHVHAVARTALDSGVEVKTLPSAKDLDRETASVSHLRDVLAVGPPYDPAT
jgi:FlaA1/EpsC-like NDP-sugar epimerase